MSECLQADALVIEKSKLPVDELLKFRQEEQVSSAKTSATTKR